MSVKRKKKKKEKRRKKGSGKCHVEDRWINKRQEEEGTWISRV